MIVQSLNRRIFGVLLVALTCAAAAIVATNQMTRRAENSVGEYLGQPLQKLELLSEIRADLGYGGATHHFKNYVLRGDLELPPRIQAGYSYALSAIRQYRTLVTSNEEHEALNAIDATVRQYQHMLVVAQSLRSQGASIEEIDQAVRVDDSAAIEAMVILGRVVRNEITYADTQTEAAMDSLSKSSSASLFLGGLSVAAILAVFIFTRRQSLALVKANSDLEHASKAKSRFLANMSHELRTPMTGVLGLIGMLKTTDLNDEQRDHVEHLDASGKSMLTIVNDILDISKIEAGKMEIHVGPARVDEVIDGVQSLFAPAARAKGLEFESDVGDGLDSLFEFDAPRLKQVVSNLVSNAIKFTPDGRVALSASLEADNIVIEVADTGMGISADQLEMIFDSFTQAETSSSRVHGGTGLGLNISRSLVELMGGDVSVKSSPGEGSVFRIVLPATGVEHDEADADAAPVAVQPIRAGIKILIVDDVATNRLVLNSMLGALGADVMQAEDGQAALDLLASNVFDLILTDIQMPVMDGIEFTRRVRAREREMTACQRLPIYAVTANVFAEQHRVYVQAGLDGVINKPYSKAEIAEVVSSVGDEPDAKSTQAV